MKTSVLNTKGYRSRPSRASSKRKPNDPETEHKGKYRHLTSMFDRRKLGRWYAVKVNQGRQMSTPDDEQALPSHVTK